jgi:ABC-2 type transport system permease protein
MTRFTTLLQREWMQHRRGWQLLMGLPIVLVALAGVFGQIHVNFDSDGVAEMPDPLVVASVSVAGVGLLCLLLAWTASLIQAPGLARRDVQDRSIEFWLSLPVPQAQSLAAMLLMHLLLIPWLALGVGLGGGWVVALLLLAKGWGLASWFSLPWGALLAAMVLLALRLMLGLALATLWLSPLILGTMAASAWLKRWGLPVVVGTIAIGGLWLDKAYGWPVVWDVLRLLGTRASQAFIATNREAAASGLGIEHVDELGSVLESVPAWVAHDAGQALAAAASPAFVAALAVAALAFGLLWMRRRRGA